MSVLYNPWHEIITQLRRSKRLTQEQAAETAGVSPKTWSRWEQDGFIPGNKQLERIVQGLGCDAEEMGMAYTAALSQRYLPADGGETAFRDVTPAELVGMTDPVADPLLTEGFAEDDLRLDLEHLSVVFIQRISAVFTASIRILFEILRQWPRYEAEATDHERQYLITLSSQMRAMLDIYLTMNHSLGEIARIKGENFLARDRDLDELDELDPADD